MFSGNLGFNPYDKNNNVSTIKNGAVADDDWMQKFLDSFGVHHIFCYNGDPRKKISSMRHTGILNEALTSNVDSLSDVYFYVNAGRKMYAINEFTCCFCDMDAGRDNEGQYFKPSIVVQHKKKFLEKINNFPVAPTWIVDTRNGYQCYWIFDDHSRKLVGQNKTYWNGLQKKLVNYFGGDPRAIKANQIYRVPYTWWRKGWEKKAPYFTRILPGCTGQKIVVETLEHALTGQSTNVIVDPAKCSDQWYKGYAKAYKTADANGLTVSADVARQILNDLTNNRSCGQKNTLDSANIDLHKNVWSNIAIGNVKGVDLNYDNIDCGEKTYGDPQPVSALRSDAGCCLNLSSHQTKLLKTVVDYLNQASTALYFSNNRFLSSVAKDLANQVGDQFCVG